MGSSNENSGFGPVLNPWDRSRVPGGSSGGSAAAVAAGLVPWALGTDTGGSVRQPAALCGVVGLKPTYGAISRYGMIAFASSLDQCGTLTRTVADSALLFAHLVGKDHCDATSLGLPEPVRMPTAERLDGIRLGVPEELTGEGIEPGVRAAFEATLRLAEGLGATVDTCRLPHAEHALSAYYVLAPAEASSNLARFDGVRYGMRHDGDGDLVSMYTRTRHDGFGDEVKRRIMLGTYALSSGYYDAYYGRAQQVRTKIADDFRAVFADFDFVVTPTSPTVAFKLGEKVVGPAQHVPHRLLHRPDAARGDPGDLDPQRAERGAAGRLPDRRPGVQREPDHGRRARAGGRDRLRRLGGALMTDYEPVIGLEIHVQLATRTKMFCGCELSFGEPPNTRTCPVCLALPGALPTANEQAIRNVLTIGLALECDLAERSVFHRKNYFYPDSPKAYQISQYDEPLCRGGRLAGVRIHRVHLEEDAAKLVHVGASGRIHGSDASIVDFNRGGTPLAEIVTEPDLHTAEDARAWLELLRTTLRQTGVSDVNMEEGSLRCDANISLRPVGSAVLGTKTELKNMNSFRFIERGIRAEVARQEEILRGGGEIEQETLHFDPRTERITSLRSKEEAHDYRYFPEPDLLPVAITQEMIDTAGAVLPELPVARQERLEGLGLNADTARQLAWRPSSATSSRLPWRPTARPCQPLANWVTGELVARIGEQDPGETSVEPDAFAALVGMVAGRTLTPANGRAVLERLVSEGGDPAAIVEAEGLAAVSDAGELEGVVVAALAANEDAAEKIRAGNMKAIGAIIGHVMRETKGRADGAEVTRIVREKLGV